MRLMSAFALALLLAGCNQPASQQAKDTDPAEAAPSAPGLSRANAGKAAPDTAFTDPDGEEVSIAHFAGKPLLVNLWASWCVPCVKELPTLQKLRDEQQDVQVISISQDMGPSASVAAFLDKHKVSDFAAYQDSKMAISGALGAEILPTTVLYDAKGKEIWRFVGDLDWTGAEAAKLLAEAKGGAGH
jgi:thiol-disulfide isomerase/thioredoxin